jgi:hypothetical protein
MELPIGTIETLVNCNSEREKKSSLKRFQLPRNTSPKRKSAKNITTDLRSLACFGHSSVFTLANLVKKTANKYPIDESLYLHRCESRRHFCRQKSSTLVFFFYFFRFWDKQLGYGLKWRFCRWKCKLWMTHYSVSECLQNPQIFFCFDFGEIHSGSDASRGPSEVKYSAKVHVRSALCHLFGVRGARNCCWCLFYAEYVTLQSLCVARLCAESVTLHSLGVARLCAESVTLHSLWVPGLCAESVTLHSLWVTGLCAESVTLHSFWVARLCAESVTSHFLWVTGLCAESVTLHSLWVTRLCAESVTYTHIPHSLKFVKKNKNQPPKYFYIWYYFMQNLSPYTLTKLQYYVQNLSPYTLTKLQYYVQNLSPYTLTKLQYYVQNLSPTLLFHWYKNCKLEK